MTEVVMETQWPEPAFCSCVTFVSEVIFESSLVVFSISASHHISVAVWICVKSAVDYAGCDFGLQ